MLLDEEPSLVGGGTHKVVALLSELGANMSRSEMLTEKWRNEEADHVSGMTALYRAVRKGHPVATRLLFQIGTNVDNTTLVGFPLTLWQGMAIISSYQCYWSSVPRSWPKTTRRGHRLMALVRTAMMPMMPSCICCCIISTVESHSTHHQHRLLK